VKKLLLSIAALAFGAVAMQAQDGNADNGKKLWVKENCYSCHGFDGHGGAGVKLAPKPIALQGFIAVVRKPPKSGMPTFSAKVVSDSDLRDMWAYLNTIPAAPQVKDVPLLSSIQ